MSTKWSSPIFGKSNVNFDELLKDEFGVILLQGKNVFGDMIYCYVKVTLPNIKKLHARLQGTGTFNPSDFGEVIAAGKGDPPPEVRAEISLTYPLLENPRVMHEPHTIPTDKKAWDEY